MTKRCCKCGEVKELSEFNKNKTRKDGHCSYCRDCQRKYYSTYYADNKQYVLTQHKDYKVEKVKERKEWLKAKRCKCEKCGEDRWYVLEFHHKDARTKEFNIAAAIYGKSIDDLEKEIQKCVVLCANCHRELHYFEDNQL